MSSAEGCPGDEPFLRLFEGRLPVSDRERLIEHVHGCSRCSLLLATPEAVSSQTRAPISGSVLVATFRSGDVLAGRYRVTRMLGAGGMGEVYEALDLSLNEALALKAVRATVADDVRAVDRLKSEVLLARRVTHPNVCRIFDFGVHYADEGDEPPLPFLTMELLTGITLHARLRERGPLALGEALDVSQQLVAGLQAAHRVQVIHKDLKAENIIVIDSPGTGLRAVITDFGLASILASSDESAEVGPRFSGTPGYVAPERLTGARVTEANDVYALGVVMFDMLTGSVPQDRAQGRAAVPSTLDAEPLLALSRRCRAGAPAERPSLEEVRLGLESLRRPRQRAVSRTARWGLAALAVAALVASLGLTSFPAKQPPAVPTEDAPRPTGAAANVVPAVPLAAPSVAQPGAAAQPALAGRRSQRRRTAAALASRPEGDRSTDRQLAEAEALLGSGHIAEACARAHIAAERDPRSFAAWEFLGRCYMRVPDPERARTYYRKSLEVAPDNRRAALIRALLETETP